MSRGHAFGDEFLERRFPESLGEALLPRVHTRTAAQDERPLTSWELAKSARAEGQQFDCALWVHKARIMPREEFQRELEKGLTGRKQRSGRLSPKLPELWLKVKPGGLHK